MDHIHVPIDYSELISQFPENEEILYSTICKAEKAVIGGKMKWKSHVLISRSGIGLIIPQKKSKISSFFFRWSEFPNVKSKYSGERAVLRYGKTLMGRITLIPIRDTNFESKKAFRQRVRKFAPFIKKIWSNNTGRESKFY